MSKLITYCCLVLLFASGCNVSRFLPPGEKLYKGPIVKVKKEKGVKDSEGSLQKQLKATVRPKPNKFLLGQPYKVWWWYVIKPKKEKGLKAWLHKKLGEPPILSSKINAPVTAEDMQAFMENIGYFHTTVKGDTINKSYFMRDVYTADVFPQYKIKSITWVSDSSDLLKELETSDKKTLLKPGKPYRLDDIETERSRLDLRLKTKGYYYFNPDYIMAYADSTIGNNEVNLFLNVKKTMPDIARHAFTINRITIFPNYSLLNPPPDTSKTGTFNEDGLLIRDTIHLFKPDLFKRVITYRPGQLYSSKDQNISLNRLINLGTFKFVKNRFDAVKDSVDDIYRLNAYYYLTPLKRKSLQGEIDGFSKENGYIGSQLSINWKNRNAFGRAEQLAIKAYGSFELSLADSLKGANNFTAGLSTSVTFPKYEIPFFNIRESSLYPPKTDLQIGYQLFIKESFYTQNVFNFQYEFDWKESSNKEHTFAPIAITYQNTANITDSFYKAAQLYPSLLLNVYSNIILGTFYTYRVTSLNPLSKNQLYFNGGIDLSGNFAGLFSGAKNVMQKGIFNTPFAQYVKFDAELTYKKILGPQLDWVNHLQVGIGIPYNNSSQLPFSKQYIIGGASSMRGFPLHALGPGTYLPNENDIKYFQTIGGDYKFLFNSELRFPIAGSLTGAVFADIGNVWTKDSILFGAAGQLTKNWYKELAVDAGFGIRYDASVLLLRLDLGIPLREPYLPDGQRWVIDKIALGDGPWRSDNLILNFAIGYPF